MNHVLRLHLSDTVDLNALGERLVHLGYTRCQQVEGMGQFALRGGILDVFGPGMEAPVRVEFFGDEVDAMGAFVWRASGACTIWSRSACCRLEKCCRP